ncbi:hypothetical protein GP486_000899 [Trichoglossum hirsutum]|uniref:Ubiquitin-like domain-containing protein n=1 Tax=Trichoglossum hirsutum TaxID=265104 RepID=A0A9P8LI16_9PEZI|nr:hypothetical protein GP486_000899 [Trichoglossum hirsutum]
MPGAPPKRSLFKKPAWSKTQTTADPVDFFSRSKEVYSDIVAEEERKRQKKIQRRFKADKKGYESSRKRDITESGDNHSSGDDDEDDSEADAPKRRRPVHTHIMLSDSDDEDSRPPPPPADDDDDDYDNEFSKSLSRKYQNIVSTKRGNKSASGQIPPKPIILSDDEDDDHVTQVIIQEPKQKETSSTENTQASMKRAEHPSDAEEEFPELARKARERARLKLIEAETTTPEPKSLNAGDRKRPSIAHPQPTPLPPDPVVQIFISSRIANTQPLIVNRRTGQRLRDVRLAWCERQGFSAEEKASVFLTWKGKRLFDVTTCKSLGISADAEGNVRWKGHEDGLIGDNKVHMEAMTEEILRDTQKVRNTGARNVSAGNTVQDVGKEPEVEERPKVEDPIRLTFKSQGYQDFKLIVKPSTPIAKMIFAFRQARKVSEDSQVFLQFDGDKLDPEVTVADTELGDMDHVDVYVR